MFKVKQISIFIIIILVMYGCAGTSSNVTTQSKSSNEGDMNIRQKIDATSAQEIKEQIFNKSFDDVEKLLKSKGFSGRELTRQEVENNYRAFFKNSNKLAPQSASAYRMFVYEIYKKDGLMNYSRIRVDFGGNEQIATEVTSNYFLH